MILDGASPPDYPADVELGLEPGCVLCGEPLTRADDGDVCRTCSAGLVEEER